MASACALAMFSGKIVFIFGIAERLRTLRYPIFTGGVGNELPQSKPTALPAPSGREPLARPEGFSLHLMFSNGANTKSPGERGCSSGRGGVQFYGVVLVSSKPMAT